MKNKNIIKFIVLSLAGIFLFFIPVQGSNVPLTIAVNEIKSVLGDAVIILPMLSISILFICVLLGKIFHIEPFARYVQGDGRLKSLIYTCTFILVYLIYFQVGPAPFHDPEVGGKVLPLAANVMITIILAGWGVVLILKSGIVEFVSVLVEPVMRPVFHLPGEAAVNCLSSFVSSASVGVYFTEQYYKEKKYTEREAVSVLMNFSVISVGYMGILTSTAGIEAYFGLVIICAFILVLIMAMICVRIPPLSGRPNVYVDGRQQSIKDRQIKKMGAKKRFWLAVEEGCRKAETFNLKTVFDSLINALIFSQKILGVMITCVTIVLTLVNYTQLFLWLGKPFVPLLQLLGMDDATRIAPAIMLGFVEVSLPSISIASSQVGTGSAFFVVMMSILQVIFMTEAGNAMLGSSLPIRFKDLLITFIIRTLIAMPLVAVTVHLLF